MTTEKQTLKDIIEITENPDGTVLKAVIHLEVRFSLDKDNIAFKEIKEEIAKEAQYSIGRFILKRAINEVLQQGGYIVDFYGEKATIKVTPFAPTEKLLIMMHPQTFSNMLSKDSSKMFPMFLGREK